LGGLGAELHEIGSVMKAEDRMTELFRRYADAVKTGTEDEALEIRKQIRDERERLEKK
jgi:hypothetical protein